MEWDKLEGKIIRDKGTGEGRYEVQKRIGTGGAGVVYLAHDIVTNKQVAVKTANPNASMSNNIERFRMEARILSKLNSRNIIAFYDHFQQEGLDMIIMEYVEGVPLEEKLKKEKRLPKQEAIHIVKQILSALEEVHAHRVFHRDIKPDNIHITVEGEVKLLDFGIVQLTDDQNLTKQGNVIGTISYLAPEIIQHPERKASTKTDVYSVGILFYELLTGVKPFKSKPGLATLGERNNNLALNILTQPAIPPHEVDATIDESLSHFVMKLIDKDPSSRYQSSTEALNDLHKVQNGEDVTKLKEYYLDEQDSSGAMKQYMILGGIAFATIALFIVSLLLILL